MKQNNIYTSIILLILFAFGCTMKDEHKIEFAVSEIATVRKINNSPFLGLPIDMIYHNKSIYISDFYGDSLLIKYNIENETYTRFGEKGNGPYEILSPSSFSLDNNKLYVFSKPNFKFGYFEIHDNNTLISRTNYQYLYNPSSSISEIAVLSNNKFITAGYYKDHRYAIIDEKGDLKHQFGEYPDYLDGEKDRSFEVKAMFHQVDFESNQSLQKVVALSNYVLDIIDYANPDISYKRVLLNDYNYNFENEQFLKTKKDESIPRGAISFSSSDQYIYILFNPNNKLNDDLMNEIWVFDWTGKTVKKITPNIKINLIAITSDDSIFAITQSDEPCIVEIKRGE